MLPELTVMENIFVGELPSTKLRLLDRKRLYNETKDILNKFGLDIPPETPTKFLSVAQQQMLEIMKAYRRNATVIAFDEPTASLMDSEIKILFRLIEELKNLSARALADRRRTASRTAAASSSRLRDSRPRRNAFWTPCRTRSWC